MQFSLAPSLRGLKSDALVVGWFEKQSLTSHRWWAALPASAQTLIQKQLRRPGFGLEWGSMVVLQMAKGPWQNVVVVGLGKKEQWNDRRSRLLMRRVVRQALTSRWSTVTIAFQKMMPSGIQQNVENGLLAGYDYRAFSKPPKSGWPELKKVVFVVDGITAEHKAAIRLGETIGTAVNEARNLANMPGSHMTPTILATAAGTMARRSKLKLTVLNTAQMKKLGMGGVLGVAKGSVEQPKFLVLEYRPAKATKTMVFVGKGVTFDSGGLNIKPDDHMNEMHMDMAGGAAVLCAVEAIAQLKLPVHAVAIVPAVENMPSGSGYRPGDLLTSMSGKVIEVMNTDAEGRIILADGLAYAQKKFKPTIIVDVATLTGSAMAALGQRAIAMFTNQSDLETQGRAIGEASGDYVWPLPMWEEYDGEIKGTFGDVINTGKTRYGGAIHGAKFLEQFVSPKMPWVHLDIAPTMTPAEGDHLAKGASGTGVRWLIELARRHSA